MTSWVLACRAVRERGHDGLGDGVCSEEPLPSHVRSSGRGSKGRHAGAVRAPGLADGVLLTGCCTGEAQHAH